MGLSGGDGRHSGRWKNGDGGGVRPTRQRQQNRGWGRHSCVGGETEEGDGAPSAWRLAIGMGGTGGRPANETKKERGEACMVSGGRDGSLRFWGGGWV